MITIGTLFLVVGAVERSHVVDWLARKTFGSDGSLAVGKLRMYITCFALSIFFNNTPLVAILMPVVKDWARMRGIAASQLLMPLSYSVLAGSFISMIGTSTNLTVQGLMEDDRGYSFPFFAPAPFGITCFAALLVYMLLTGPILLPNNKSGLIREARDKAASLIAEVYVSEHSFAVGRSLGDMMNSLGVAPSNAIKIRRKVQRPVVANVEENNEDDAENEKDPRKDGLRKSRSSLILDTSYLKKQAEFWLVKPAVPERLDGQARNSSISSEVNHNEEKPREAQADVEAALDSYHDIIVPSHLEPICAGDIVFISSAQDAIEKMMKSILGESRGLYILRSNVMALPGFGSEVVELVISDTNPFVGRKLEDLAGEFAEKYRAGIITVRAKDWNMNARDDEDKDSDSDEQVVSKSLSLVPSEEPLELELTQATSANSSNNATGRDESSSSRPLVAGVPAHVSISDHILSYGDVVLVVTSKSEAHKLAHNRDFFVASTVGDLPQPLTFYRLIPLYIFIVMLCLVAAEYIEMCPAALTVTAVYFMGGWITPDDIPKMVDIRLLMLMGCSLSFAKAMTKSGLAVRVASGINDADPSNFGALLLVYAITLVITELISNNAAAALMYPIAVALADELGVSFKPFAMAVLISSTAGFMSPIGYQTHVMVWGPGGYRFRDFVIWGVVPDLIYWFIGCALIPAIYPF